MDSAIGELTKAIELDPHFGSARVALARAYLRKYDFEGGREWLDRGLEQTDQALAQGGVIADALMAAATLHEAAGSGTEAVAALEQAILVAPADGEAQLRLARALEASGRLDEAEQRYQHSIFLRRVTGRPTIGWPCFT